MEGSTGRKWLPWALASVVLVGVGLALLILGARGQDVGPSIPGPIGSTGVPPVTASTQSMPGGGVAVNLVSFNSTVSSTSTLTPSTAAPERKAAVAKPTHRRVGPAFLARSRPIHLWIPTLQLSVPLSVLGLNPDGSVQVPTDYNVPGWYKYGPTPGERGSAVILGHVDTFRGPAVFFYLRNLRPGNQVIVELADHKIARFAVLGLRMYTKAQFPERIVYGSRPYSALQLVTCGGVFDHSTHHYLSNIVVYTKRIA